MNQYLRLLIVLALPLHAAAAESSNSQEGFNPIPVASPTLLVAPDARSSGMGDVGVATAPDAASQHWNAAKYAFIENSMGVMLGYSPWLRQLVPDVNIAYLSYFWKYRELEAVAFSLRYFSLGNMQIVDQWANTQADASPYELAIDGAWTRRFGDNFSASLTARYIRSDLIGGVAAEVGNGNYVMQPANVVSFDVGAYYQKPIRRDEVLAFGLNLSNLGTKVNYSTEASGYFLPMNIRLGARYGLPIDEDNYLTFAVDFNKLLVPTPALRATAGDSTLQSSQAKDVSVPLAILKSFGDAPFGFTEELAEINFGIGAEYKYRNTFFARTGFYYDSKRKGNRRYMTFGAGLKYNMLQLDIAYYVPFTSQDPMANTVKLSLAMYFGESKASPSSSSYSSPSSGSTTRRRRASPADRTGTTTDNAEPAAETTTENTGTTEAQPAATQRNSGTTQRRQGTSTQQRQGTTQRSGTTTQRRTTTPTR